MEDSPSDVLVRRRTRRQELIDQVANGLSPDEAERIAVGEGHGSLLNNPTYADIDGFAEPRWTLLMAFAWAAWGQNPDHIRLYFPDYRAQCREWVRAGKGHIIAPMKLYNAHGAIQPLRQDWHNDIGSVVGSTGATARLAWDNLRAKFRSDQVRTFGQLVNETASGVVPIPAVNWQGLLLMPPTGQLVDSLCYADGQPVYFNVTVERASLLAVYPPVAGENLRDKNTTTSTDPAPKRSRGHASAIEAAVSKLWPNGVPAGLPVAERNNQIFGEMQRQGTTTKTSIDSVTFRRFFRN